MDFSSAFDDVDSPADVFINAEADASDFLMGFESSGEESPAGMQDGHALQAVGQGMDQQIAQVESRTQEQLS